MTQFVARAKEAGPAGAADVANILVRGFGAEAEDFAAAAAVLAGFETYSWTIIHWAGPSSSFAPNQTDRPAWLAKLVDDEEEEDEESAAEKTKDRTPATALSLKSRKTPAT